MKKLLLLCFISLAVLGNGCSNVTSLPINQQIDEYEDVDIEALESRVSELEGIAGSIESVNSFISLDSQAESYHQSPIKFVGNVSPDTSRIVVTALYGGKTDVYTLKDYAPGSASFEYQAAEKWNNLATGQNTYYFQAYFNDGSSNIFERTISYYPPVVEAMPIPISPPVSKTVQPPAYVAPSTTRSCCKTCVTGKACGDSCISKSYTCHKGPGCACNQ
ncbi:MAG: hypothetical protein WAZ14_03145 [Patescibacteria group bacterium]